MMEEEHVTLVPLHVIVSHIFPKLPLKSLLRCKLVCKFWSSVIDAPYLSKLHLNRVLLLSHPDSTTSINDTRYLHAKLDSPNWIGFPRFPTRDLLLEGGWVWIEREWPSPSPIHVTGCFALIK